MRRGTRTRSADESRWAIRVRVGGRAEGEAALSLVADPLLLMGLSTAELTAYRLCLDERKRARQHFYMYGGLYGLHLLGWLHQGFSGEQFLFVRMTSLPKDKDSALRLPAALCPAPTSRPRHHSATSVTFSLRTVRRLYPARSFSLQHHPHHSEP